MLLVTKGTCYKCRCLVCVYVSLSLAEFLGLSLYFRPCSYLLFPFSWKWNFCVRGHPFVLSATWYLVGLRIHIPTSNCKLVPVALHPQKGGCYHVCLIFASFIGASLCDNLGFFPFSASRELGDLSTCLLAIWFSSFVTVYISFLKKKK